MLIQGRGGAGGGGGPGTPAAPIMEGLSNGGDLINSEEPGFIVEVRNSLELDMLSDTRVGDVLELNDLTTTIATLTLTAAFFDGDAVSWTYTGSFAEGAASARCRLTRGSNASTWSNTFAFTVDLTAPVLSSPTAAATYATDATASVSTDEGNGTLYWVCYTGAPDPSIAQVLAGLDGSNAAAPDSANQAVVATGVQTTRQIVGLSASTNYKVAFVHQDQAGNNSAVSVSAQFTTQAAFVDPTSITGLKEWMKISDLTTLFQSNAGTTAADTNGQSVGFVNDKSANNFDLTSSADDTTRPTLQGVGVDSYLQFNGTNQKLRKLTDLGMWSSATGFSIFLRARGKPNGVSDHFIWEGSGSPHHGIMMSGGTVATTMSSFARGNDAATTMIGITDLTVANAWNDTDRVVGVTDNLSTRIMYLDGVALDSVNYTRSVALTPATFCIGCELRSTGAAFFEGRLYELVAYNKVLSLQERLDLMDYLTP